MNLKVKDYLNSIPIIESVVFNNKDKTISEQISYCAIASNVPIVVVTFLYEKLYGASEELSGKRERLIKFYNCTVEE